MIQLALVLWVCFLQPSKSSSGRSSRNISSWGELFFRYILTSWLSLMKNTHFFNSSGKCLREHSPLWWYSSSTSWYNTWGKTKDIYFKVLKAFYKSKRCVHGNLILLKRKSSISAIDISSHMSVNKGTKSRLGKKDKYISDLINVRNCQILHAFTSLPCICSMEHSMQEGSMHSWLATVRFQLGATIATQQRVVCLCQSAVLLLLLQWGKG